MRRQMRMRCSKLLTDIFFIVASLMLCGIVKCDVSYDRKAITIGGERKMLIGGSIHYPRSTPEMWEDLIQKAKDGGLNVIDTYVFWNGHEPSQGNYNFEGRYDLVRFVKTVHKAGLFVTLRIGPYVCAEWNFGGLPVWLNYVPGVSFRTENEPFKNAMKGFTKKIIQMMKDERLFASQGGPIVVSQIENEFGPQAVAVGEAGRSYSNWAASMAVGTGTGVPWIMCKEEDAPDPVINTCNGFYCDDFSPNKPNKPTMWTEAWSGWFSEFGDAGTQRRVEDLAFAVARFIEKGGSYVNYYMYHGGTNFGRTAGGPFITTSYDYDAPLDEYGLIRDPKYTHLKELHRAIKLCEDPLLNSDPKSTSLGSYQRVTVFSSDKSNCAAFISNFDSHSSSTVWFNNKLYKLPPWSISILPDCRHEAFNTAKVKVQATEMQMSPSAASLRFWESYPEESSSLTPNLKSTGLLEQLNITRDTTDYLWYFTTVHVDPSESFLHGGEQPRLTVHSSGHGLHVFVNGEYSGSAYGSNTNRQFTFRGAVNLRSGKNKIGLLSLTIGLPNGGIHYETWETGITGPVSLKGLDGGKRDLSWHKWSYQIGLKGEAERLFSSFNWRGASSPGQSRSTLVWYKAYFDQPRGDEPLALDMGSMGKGAMWVNGQHLGRYWLMLAHGNCGRCDYRGAYRPRRCQVGCGQPTQRWYHVPRSWLKATDNLLVILEEVGGNVHEVSLVKRSEK